MVHKLKLVVDVASLVTVTKTVWLTSSVPAVRVSTFPITAASRFTEEREILKISTLEKLSFTDASKEFKQQQGTPPKSDISYSQAATRAAQPIQYTVLVFFFFWWEGSNTCSQLGTLVQQPTALAQQMTIRATAKGCSVKSRFSIPLNSLLQHRAEKLNRKIPLNKANTQIKTMDTKKSSIKTTN